MLEHVPEPQSFAQKALATGATVILSVPYRWSAAPWSTCTIPWMSKSCGAGQGVAPVETVIVEDGGRQRLIAVYTTGDDVRLHRAASGRRALDLRANFLGEGLSTPSPTLVEGGPADDRATFCLDASFLELESSTAHMHVGWGVALFDTPDNGRRAALRGAEGADIGHHLCRAPRYRQKLSPVPLGLHAPLWVDDPDFDLARHVRRTTARRLDEVTERGDVRAARP